MIELLAVQAITNLALAFFIIKLRRELWPMIAGAGPVSAGFWLRSVDVFAVQAPQFDVAKTVIKVRWLFSEELHLTYKFRVYDIAMDPVSRLFYKEWREWVGGSTKYDCRVKKPRGLSRLYSKAIDVFCKEKKVQERDVVIVPTRRRKRKCNLQCYKRRYGHYPPPRYP
jgi:hypothetical protein